MQVTALYPGASAETIASTVAGPIEQEINGVDGMLYLSSQSTGDGRVNISVVFRQGVDVDQAQVLVQNRVAIAEPRLPEDVRRLGVTVKKASPDFLMVVHMLSPDGSRSPEFVSNYATLTIKDRLARLDGVGDAHVFGARDYAMRVWLDPDRVAARGLSAGDVVAALQRANVQVAAGAIGQAPRADECRRLRDRAAGAGPAGLARAIRRAGDRHRREWRADPAARRRAHRDRRRRLHHQCAAR